MELEYKILPILEILLKFKFFNLIDRLEELAIKIMFLSLKMYLKTYKK